MSDAAFRHGMRTVMGDPVLLREWLGSLTPTEFYALNEASDDESQRRVTLAIGGALGRVAAEAPNVSQALRNMGQAVAGFGVAMRRAAIAMDVAHRHAMRHDARIRWETARPAPAPHHRALSAYSAPSGMVSVLSARVSVWPPSRVSNVISVADASVAASLAVDEAISAGPQPGVEFPGEDG